MEWPGARPWYIPRFWPRLPKYPFVRPGKEHRDFSLTEGSRVRNRRHLNWCDCRFLQSGGLDHCHRSTHDLFGHCDPDPDEMLPLTFGCFRLHHLRDLTQPRIPRDARKHECKANEVEQDQLHVLAIVIHCSFHASMTNRDQDDTEDHGSRVLHGVKS
jgi:hypothetical protein